jgi:hypothetical protein
MAEFVLRFSLAGETEELHRDYHYSQSLGKEMDLAPPVYEAGVLPLDHDVLCFGLQYSFMHCRKE